MGETINRDTIVHTGWIRGPPEHVEVEPIPNPHMPGPLWPHQLALFRYMYTYETNGVTVSETSVFRTQVGILCDRRGTGKRTTLLSYISTFPRGHRTDRLPMLHPLLGIGHWETRDNEPTQGGNLFVVPHCLITQWARQVGTFEALYALVLPNLSKWKGTQAHIAKFDAVVISSTIIGQFFNRYKHVRWSRVVFDEVDSIGAINCPHFQAHMFWFISPHPKNLLHPSEWNDRHLLEALFPGGGMLYAGFLRQTFQRLAYYTDEHEEISRLFLRTHEQYLNDSVVRPRVEYDTIRACKHPTELTSQELVDFLDQCDDHDMMYVCGIRPRGLKSAIYEGKNVWRDQVTSRLQGDPEALYKMLEEKQGDCMVCMETFEHTGCLSCCMNFVCMNCVRKLITTTFRNNPTGFPWSIKCPCCRNLCPLPWISYTDENVVVPEWPIFEPYVDQVIQSIDPDVKTVLLLRDWTDIELWSSALESAGVDYRILHGTYTRINKLVEDFRRGKGCKLLVLRHLHRGYHLFPEHIISTDRDESIIQEFVDLCAIDGPNSSPKIRVSMVKIESMDVQDDVST